MAKTLNDLPVGAKVKAKDSKWYGKDLIFRKLGAGHSQDPANSVILQTNDIISVRCFDAKEPTNSDSNRQNYGNNRYLHSNLLQWLNSDAGANAWYSAQHAADQKPDSANVWQNSGTAVNPYDTQAGFMNGFTADFKNSLLTVTKRTAKNTVTDSGGYEDVQSKFFLLSTTEVGLANENNVAEGELYSLFNDATKRIMVPTQECADNSVGYAITAGSAWYWWLRTPYSSNSGDVRLVFTDGSLNSYDAFGGHGGLAPACAISKDQKVSDSVDSDGCYVLLYNQAPEIDTETTLGEHNAPFSISYKITDPDGDTCSATVKLDGTTIATHNPVDQSQTYSYTIPGADFNSLALGSHTFTFTATDSESNTNTVTATFTKTASPVVISGADADLGNKWVAPTITYQAGSNDSTDVSVTETIDGETTRTIDVVDQSALYTFDLSSWDELSDEQSHSLVITAENTNHALAVRTYTLTKLANALAFYTRSVTTDEAAEKINVALNYDKTNNPTVKIEVTNDANAPQCHWEDMTEEWTDGKAHTFENEPADVSYCGVAVRITLTKNENTERVYVYALGFSFV